MVVSESNSENTELENSGAEPEKNIFSDIKYICGSSVLILESLQKGLDVAQLPSGDVIVTEIKTINTQYTWDEIKQKMVKLNQNF